MFSIVSVGWCESACCDWRMFERGPTSLRYNAILLLLTNVIADHGPRFPGLGALPFCVGPRAGESCGFYVTCDSCVVDQRFTGDVFLFHTRCSLCCLSELLPWSLFIENTSEVRWGKGNRPSSMERVRIGRCSSSKHGTTSQVNYQKENLGWGGVIISGRQRGVALN